MCLSFRLHDSAAPMFTIWLQGEPSDPRMHECYQSDWCSIAARLVGHLVHRLTVVYTENHAWHFAMNCFSVSEESNISIMMLSQQPCRGSALCSPVPMFPGRPTYVPRTYIPRHLCSPVPMFPDFVTRF